MELASSYDAIAELYDEWSTSVTEDIDFYVAEALKAEGSIVELGIGTGRIALAIADAGVPVIGVDSSAGMLGVARRRAAELGVAELLDLREGDFRRPPVTERVELVTAPFRSLLHLHTDADRSRTRSPPPTSCSSPAGGSSSTCSRRAAPTSTRRTTAGSSASPGSGSAPAGTRAACTLTLELRGPTSETSMQLAWLPPERWDELLTEAGFEIEECYGWFDRRPYDGHEDSVWIVRRPAE